MATQPPFFGTRVIGDIAFGEIEALIDREALFVGRWQFRKGQNVDEWREFRKQTVLPIYERVLSKCVSRNIIVPKMIYGYFKCEKSGNGLVVSDERRSHRFDFPREKRTPHRCVADYFPDGFVAMQVVTVGDVVNKEAKELFMKNSYSETFYLKGLAAEAAESVAKFCHNYIRRELGVADDVGERFSPGYPSFPDLLAQRKIVALLGPTRIGVVLTRTCMFVPEQTTSAIVSVDPKACRFNPNM